jgi:hypothetical protein
VVFSEILYYFGDHSVVTSSSASGPGQRP